MNFFDLYDRANKIKRERVEKIDSFVDVLLDLMYGEVGIFDTISIIQNEFQKEVHAFGPDDVKEFLTDFVRKTYPDFFKDKIINVQLLVPSGGIKIGKKERNYYLLIYPEVKGWKIERTQNEINDTMDGIKERELEENEFIKFKAECNLFMDKIGYTMIQKLGGFPPFFFLFLLVKNLTKTTDNYILSVFKSQFIK